LDAISLFFGLLFAGFSIVALFGNVDIGTVAWEAWGPALAIVGGIFFLVLAIDRSRRNRSEDDMS
jgi:TRAP-type C4-dicarboxylate transport system permease small subunit